MMGACAVHTGLAEQKFFVRPLLNTWGVQHHSSALEEYKTVLNTMVYRGYTKPHREAAHRWLSSCMDQITQGVVETRGLPRGRRKHMLLYANTSFESTHTCACIVKERKEKNGKGKKRKGEKNKKRREKKRKEQKGKARKENKMPPL